MIFNCGGIEHFMSSNKSAVGNRKELDYEDLQYLPFDQLICDHPYSYHARDLQIYENKYLSKLFDTDKDIEQEKRAVYQGYTKEWTMQLKISIKYRDGYICQICGTRETKATRLHVHHVSYNKKDNNPLNLVSLCPGCHATTNHNRPSWIEFFKNNPPSET